MKCPSCKGRMERGKTSLPYELANNKLIVVRGVPALICVQCGEDFIESSVLKRVEEILHAVEKDGMILGFLEYREAA